MVTATAAGNKVADNRRANLRALMKLHGPQELARMLGYTNSSFLVQMAGPNPTRPVTENSCTRFEQALGLPQGAMSEPAQVFAEHVGIPATAPLHMSVPAVTLPTGETLPADQMVPMVLDVLTLVQRVSNDEQVTLPAPKFNDLVAMAFRDSLEHGGPRQDFVRSILRLVKS